MIGSKGFMSRKSSRTLFFGGREATTGNASAVRRLANKLQVNRTLLKIS